MNCIVNLGNGKALFQQAYVGNMAWAHVVALSALNRDCHTTGGQAYFINDDTPITNTFQFMEPFLKARGLSIANYSIPYPVVYFLMFLTENVLKLIAPVYKINFDTALCSIIYINKTYYFSRTKAQTLLGFKPLYSWKQSLENSMDYYMKLEL